MLDEIYWVDQFKAKRSRYMQLTTELSYLVGRLLKENQIQSILVEKRTKGIKEFKEKITRPGKSYKDPLQELTDLSGVRIILKKVSTVDKVCDLIIREFEVDEKRSVRRATRLEVDQFGYQSDHLIVKINANRRDLTEWVNLRDLWGEIQVRTALQHAWGSVSRELDYNNSFDMPAELRRKLFRLSALFELADEQFDIIEKNRQELIDSYSEQLKTQTEDIAINVDSLRTYLNDSETVKYWTSYIKSLGVKIGSFGALPRAVKMSYKAGISNLNELDELLNRSKGWGETFLRQYYETAHSEAISQKRLSMDRNGVVTLFLIANFPLVFTVDYLEMELGWGDANIVIEAARRTRNLRDDTELDQE